MKALRCGDCGEAYELPQRLSAPLRRAVGNGHACNPDDLARRLNTRRIVLCREAAIAKRQRIMEASSQ
ncbi:MAG: hypothetical protein OXG44_06225 [Gammaproteobacteria bacterium]|nr:hypothetical protein [Gammaproteobacteria bacterium]